MTLSYPPKSSDLDVVFHSYPPLIHQLSTTHFKERNNDLIAIF